MRMFRRTVLFFYFFSAFVLSGQTPPEHTLRTLTVTGKRTLKDIGLERVVIDSAALKENVALSMADVLTFNSAVFVKNYGRATMSTVSFRGTSPGHTQVSWNGMQISNPMTGMADFSLIPAYFVDRASLLYGSSSVAETSGALGGMVAMTTLPQADPGFHMQYVQGVGSYRTFDEFLHTAWANDRWHIDTRAVYNSSPNDFKYINHDKKTNIYDDNHNIIGSYHPHEKNKSGAFRDFHVLQEAYFHADAHNTLSAKIWLTSSNREMPLLSTDYADETSFENRQKETTLRAVATWAHHASKWSATINTGYTHTQSSYLYRREIVPEIWSDMSDARAHVNTLYARGEGTWQPRRQWLFTASACVNQYFVRSSDHSIVTEAGDMRTIGYHKGRYTTNFATSAKWLPAPAMGINAVLRAETFGNSAVQYIPALLVDYNLLHQVSGNSATELTIRASASRNHKFPSLNDLYFMPGGNPGLRSEKGFTYDAGATLNTSGKSIPATLQLSANWFDSYISDWIIWLPTTKGYFTPRNVKKIHSYGVETNGSFAASLPRGWHITLNGTYAWTPSINDGNSLTDDDTSVGKQLPYIPRHSASATAHVKWQQWAFTYKWCWYSRRYTMSSNETTFSGQLPQYFMSNICLERNLDFRPMGLQLKLSVNNLFNEDYVSVLSHPMPGINFEFFVGITPKL